MRRSANTEAITHLTTALELLQTLPATSERSQQELGLQMALVFPLIATKGYAAPEVEHAYTQARELCQHIGDPPQLFSVLYGQWEFYTVRGEYKTTHELGEQLLSLAQRTQDPTHFLQTHIVQGNTLLWFGELVPARAHLEQALALYDPQRHHSLAFFSGTDPGVLCGFSAAQALWHLGYPDQARKRSDEALTLAQKLAHPLSLVVALSYDTIIHQLRGEGPAAHDRLEAMIALWIEQGVTSLMAWGTFLLGWVRFAQGQKEEGIAQMRQSLTVMQTKRESNQRSQLLALMAEMYGKAGQEEEGLTVLAEAFALVDKIGEHFYEAEMYKLKGELTRKQSGVRGPESGFTNPQPLTPNPQAEAEAEACFLKAIEIARRQQAKSLELRAVMSLARLWQQQGKTAEARQMLAETYGWFTEGFDTKDLQEAKTLLDELVEGH